MAAVSTLEVAWAGMAVFSLGMTIGWLITGVVVLVKRQPRRIVLAQWLSWPLGVAVVALLYVTHLPLTARVLASGGALTEFVEAARASDAETGRVGLFHVSRYKVVDGCVFLEAGESMDGVAGIVYVPRGVEAPRHPDWSATDSCHLVGPWWYFETRS